MTDEKGARGAAQGTHSSPPERPSELSRRSWWEVSKRTLAEFNKDNLPDHAAALTYYGILAIFPALVAVVSVVGLFGSTVTKPLLQNLGSFAPGPARQILAMSLAQLQHRQTAAGIALVISVAIALWSASGYVAAFMRAANNVYDIGEGRPLWKKLPVRLGVTAVLVILLTVTAVGVVATGDLATRVGQLLGLGPFAVLVWDIVKWPVLIVLASAMIALLYWAAPNVRQPNFRWITPGSVLAVLLWIVASALFGVYVANFADYNKTYGSLAGFVIFLVWLWISNMAFLLGIEFNAEIQRGRALEAGHPKEKEPYVEPRDTRKLKP